MAINDIYSKRQKASREGAIPDVYVYDTIPMPLRVQIARLLRDLYGHPTGTHFNKCIEAFGFVEQVLSNEYGLFTLPGPSSSGYPLAAQHADERVINFLLNEQDHERVLDVVEIGLSVMNFSRTHNAYWSQRVTLVTFEDAVSELNQRFREHGIGYQYEADEIIRVDSQLLHNEVVKPSLALLTAPEYAGANQEFLKAFEHYRNNNPKECLNECLKAFESTMKAICAKRNWKYQETDTANTLIKICFDNGLFPPMLESHMSALRTGLTSGIPTTRNKLGGHGQGTKIVEVPPHYASYMLHLTATTIKLFAESEKALG